MSADGRVIVGQSGNDLFRWTEATGMVPLPKPSGYEECIPNYQKVSADGTIVAALCSLPRVGSNFFRWKGTSAPQMVPLPPGSNGGSVIKMTSDGSVIFGDITRGGMGDRAFRWSESTGTVEMGLPGYARCWVLAHTAGRFANADATVLMGSCDTPSEDGGRASSVFRWTPGTAAVILRPLVGDDEVFPEGMNADGSIIMGRSLREVDVDANREMIAVPVFWDANGKPTAVRDVFASLGFDLKGFELLGGVISPADDHVIFGGARNAAGVNRGWIARVP
jgi:hypothetical protein